MATRRKARTRRWRSPAKRTTSARKRSARKRGASGARAIWKGIVSFGSFTLPVKLYSAAQDKSIHFRLLDAKTKQPVKQHMVDADSGAVVENEHTHKALPVSRRKMVVLEEAELEKVAPKDSRDVDVSRFVPSDAISHEWFERPYWLGPDGDDAKKYFALVQAMQNEARDGFARWTMRKREYAGALRVERGYLMLLTLRTTNQVIAASQLTPPGGREPDKREVEMAHKLVESMEGDLDMTQFRDTYRDRVLELVEAKAKGKVIRFPRERRVAAKDTNLESLLKKSLATAQRKHA